MKFSLFITYFEQKQFWPYCLESIRYQTRKPDEIILGIDSDTDSIPDLQGLNFSVVRPYGKNPARSGRGLCINQALKLSACEIMVTTDADCILHPRLIEYYEKIYTSRLTKWEYTVHGGGGRKPYRTVHAVKKSDVLNQIFVGPRFFIPLPNKLPEVSGNLWEDVDGLSTHDYHGCRGREGHVAKIMGCNMAFFTRLFKYAQFKHGRGQDETWQRDLERKRPKVFTVRPAPDYCYVLHMGPNNVGQYW